MGEWRECPGGRAEQTVSERAKYLARCPRCGFTFSTLMDEPTVPPHWLGPDGAVMFRPRS